MGSMPLSMPSAASTAPAKPRMSPALLRDARGVAALGVPLTLVVERPDGVEYHRTLVADQGLGGHSLTLPIAASAPTGTWRVRAFTDPKRPPVGEATFLVEDYVPDRIEFDLNSTSGTVSQKSRRRHQRGRPFPLWRAGGRPRSRRRYDDRRGEGAKRICRLSVRFSRRRCRSSAAAARRSAVHR